MISFILENFNTLLVVGECSILGDDLAKTLKYIYTAIQISVPALVILLCTVDLVKAVAASQEADMKKVRTRAIKRLIIGAFIFFVPTVVDYALYLVGISNGSCNIGGN